MENLNKKIFTKKQAAFLSLYVGIGMLIMKIGAYLLTDSAAIFSDATESVVHLFAVALAVYSIILSAKPADESHFYGHGNIEYFSAGIEGFLIIVAAGVIIYHAILAFYNAQVPVRLGVGTIIIAVAGTTNLLLGFYLIKKGKSTNSLVLEADGKHILTDSFTSFGIVFGLILVLITKIYFIDQLVAVIIALNILITGYRIVRESIGGLMNETDKKMLNDLIKILLDYKKEYWIDIHNLRFRKSAEKVFIDFHVILPYYFTIKESHVEEDYITEKIEKIIPVSETQIHLDYCDETLCKFCNNKDCDVRAEPKSKEVQWTKEKIIGEPLNING